MHQILTNEKYIGNNVYNRTSFKLKIKHRQNPPSEWIRKDDAFEVIVPMDQRRLSKRFGSLLRAHSLVGFPMIRNLRQPGFLPWDTASIIRRPTSNMANVLVCHATPNPEVNIFYLAPVIGISRIA
ncbi:recombinase family protein [Cupriavidus oxalaticus]|uniref:recombinase family protein n=1 Tax=Cupriavidus oxalaticus TaxID=96344 RepID=UPI001E5E3314|nr:recombinase family protein [Cupriavidus oxalaticus]